MNETYLEFKDSDLIIRDITNRHIKITHVNTKIILNKEELGEFIDKLKEYYEDLLDE